MEAFAPSSAEGYGAAALHVAFNATPVRNEAAKLFTSTNDNFIQQQVFEMVPRIAGRSSRFSMITLIHRILMIPSNKGMLFPPVTTCLTYSAILKPCAHAMLSYDTLTGTDRFT